MLIPDHRRASASCANPSEGICARSPASSVPGCSARPAVALVGWAIACVVCRCPTIGTAARLLNDSGTLTRWGYNHRILHRQLHSQCVRQQWRGRTDHIALGWLALSAELLAFRYELSQQEPGGSFRIRCRVEYRHRYFPVLVPDGHGVGRGAPATGVNDTATRARENLISAVLFTHT
jgi:hypothetical protein